MTEVPLVRTALEIDGRRLALGLPAELLRGFQAGPSNATEAPARPSSQADPDVVAAPITGTLQAWSVANGDLVAQGAAIAVMEAMKMEMQVSAPRAGRITFDVQPGAYVVAGTPLASIR